MSRRTPGGGGAAAAASSVAAAAAASSSPAAAAASARPARRSAAAHDHDDGDDEKHAAGGGAAAAAAAHPAPPVDMASVVAQLTAGLSWVSVTAVLRSLIKEVSSERLDLPRYHAPLLDVACTRLKRAGKEGERDAACKNVVARCRRDMERLVEKEEQLGALLAALHAAQNAAAAGELNHDQDWTEFIKKAIDDAQTSEYHNKLESSLKKSLDEFDQVCWRVNHAAEPLPGRGGRAAGGAAAAAAAAGGGGGEDDEVVTVDSGALTAADLIDPFTKGPLEDPLRARQCGHRFSRLSITQFLERRFRWSGLPGAVAGPLDPAFEATCQAAGCRKMLCLNSLIPDAAAARAVARMQADERRQARAAAAAGGGDAAQAASDARVAAAAAQAAAKRARDAAKRKRGTIKQEPGGSGAQEEGDEDDDAAVNDLTQLDEEEAPAAKAPRRSASRKA